MSSTVSSTLSAGAQLLAGYSNLLPGPADHDLSPASSGSATREIHPTEETDVRGESQAAPVSKGDSVHLSSEALQMLGSLDHGWSPTDSTHTPATEMTYLSAHVGASSDGYERIDLLA